MPRNASGTYTLPSGNPVSAGTLIDANWANNTLNDMANEMTDSLSRSGEGGMLAPFRITDGLQATPSLAFTNEPSTGLYRAGTNEMWAVVGGTQITQFTATGMAGRFAAGAVTTPSITVHGDLNTGIYFPGADQVAIATGGVQRLSVDASGGVSVPGTFNVTGNVTIDTNTLFVDAASNRVGVGTVTPAVRLDVAGGISIANSDNLTWGGAYGATTPAIAGSAGFLAFYPNGSTSGEQMRLNSTGLGIGTTSPGARLDVVGSGTTPPTKIYTSGTSSAITSYSATAGLQLISYQSDTGPFTKTAAIIANADGTAPSLLQFWTKADGSSAPTERMRLDASGNLLIGSTSGSHQITLGGYNAIGGVTGNSTGFVTHQYLSTSGEDFMGISANFKRTNTSSGTYGNANHGSAEVGCLSAGANGFITFSTTGSANTVPTERARITSGGLFFVNTTTTLRYADAIFQCKVVNGWAGTFQHEGTSAANGALACVVENTNGRLIRFQYQATEVGAITTNGTNTTYGTGSDVRLKKDIVPAPDAGADVDAINIVSFKWKSNGSETKYGVVAQELVNVSPEAVQKGDDSEDVVAAWGVDYSKLVPMLVKEIQSLRTRVAQLEAK